MSRRTTNIALIGLALLTGTALTGAFLAPPQGQDPLSIVAPVGTTHRAATTGGIDPSDTVEEVVTLGAANVYPLIRIHAGTRQAIDINITTVRPYSVLVENLTLDEDYTIAGTRVGLSPIREECRKQTGGEANTCDTAPRDLTCLEYGCYLPIPRIVGQAVTYNETGTTGSVLFGPMPLLEGRYYVRHLQYDALLASPAELADVDCGAPQTAACFDVHMRAGPVEDGVPGSGARRQAVASSEGDADSECATTYQVTERRLGAGSKDTAQSTETIAWALRTYSVSWHMRHWVVSPLQPDLRECNDDGEWHTDVAYTGFSVYGATDLTVPRDWSATLFGRGINGPRPSLGPVSAEVRNPAVGIMDAWERWEQQGYQPRSAGVDVKDARDISYYNDEGTYRLLSGASKVACWIGKQAKLFGVPVQIACGTAGDILARVTHSPSYEVYPIEFDGKPIHEESSGTDPVLGTPYHVERDYQWACKGGCFQWEKKTLAGRDKTFQFAATLQGAMYGLGETSVRSFGHLDQGIVVSGPADFAIYPAPYLVKVPVHV